MALSRASSLQKQRGRPVRNGGFPFLYGSLYNSLDLVSPEAYLYRSLQISGDFPMTHIDLVQAQNFVRQQANWPGKKLRRQLFGASLLLLSGGGYAFYHANAKPA